MGGFRKRLSFITVFILLCVSVLISCTGGTQTGQLSPGLLEAPPPSAPEGASDDAAEGETEEKGRTCTLFISCASAVKNPGRLSPEKLELLPEDGVILPVTEVSFEQGESVFDVLLRETRRSGVHMEFVKTPFYDSAYIEGIANLYEMDCGELSGWLYLVNGVSPGYGCSRYFLSDGDEIEWLYTCDMGKDVGAEGEFLQVG